MSPEQSLALPPNKEITSDDLLKVCWNYSDFLSGKQWSDLTTTHVELERVIGSSVLARLPDEAPTSIASLDSADHSKRTVRFEAEKWGDGDELHTVATIYRIIHTESQQLALREIEPYVMREIVLQNNGEDDSYSTYFDEENYNAALVEQGRPFERRMTQSYGIDEEGDVCDTQQTMEYYYNDAYVLGEGYQFQYFNEQDESIITPVDKRFSNEIDYSEQTQFEVNRKAMTLIALSASGLIPIKKLLKG